MARQMFVWHSTSNCVLSARGVEGDSSCDLRCVSDIWRVAEASTTKFGQGNFLGGDGGGSLSAVRATVGLRKGATMSLCNDDAGRDSAVACASDAVHLSPEAGVGADSCARVSRGNECMTDEALMSGDGSVDGDAFWAPAGGLFGGRGASAHLCCIGNGNREEACGSAAVNSSRDAFDWTVALFDSQQIRATYGFKKASSVPQWGSAQWSIFTGRRGCEGSGEARSKQARCLGAELSVIGSVLQKVSFPLLRVSLRLAPAVSRAAMNSSERRASFDWLVNVKNNVVESHDLEGVPVDSWNLDGDVVANGKYNGLVDLCEMHAHRANKENVASRGWVSSCLREIFWCCCRLLFRSRESRKPLNGHERDSRSIVGLDEGRRCAFERVRPEDDTFETV
eukprot:IDg7695t1